MNNTDHSYNLPFTNKKWGHFKCQCGKKVRVNNGQMDIHIQMNKIGLLPHIIFNNFNRYTDISIHVKTIKF